MCLSPEADLIAGAILGVLAVDALRRRPSPADLPLALVPAVLALHSVIEAFVWYAGRGQVDPVVGTIATYAYLVIAFVVLPTLLPVAIRTREPQGRHRHALTALLGLGVLVSGVLGVAIAVHPVTAILEPHFVRYEADIPFPGLVVSAYVVATCGAPLLSSSRAIQVFGLVNLLAVAVLMVVNSAALTSLWCGWAVLASVAIVIQIRTDEAAARRLLAAG